MIQVRENNMTPLTIHERGPHGRPILHQTEERLANSSIFLQNKQFKVLRPSQDRSYRIIRWITALFKKIIAPLYSPPSPHHLGIVAAFDRTTRLQEAQLSTVSLNELVHYFDRFLDKDEDYDTEMKNCISHLKNQLTLVEAVETTSTPASINKLRSYHQSFIQDVTKLKPGQKRIFVASQTPGNQVFYLFARGTDGAFSFQILGRGPALQDISGVEEVQVAGRAKIVASVKYENIKPSYIQDASWLEALLQQSFYRTPYIPQVILNLTKHLAEFKKPNLELDDLAQQTDNLAKSLWSTLKQLRKNKGKESSSTEKTHSRRLHLRVGLNALFDLFKEHKDTLKTNCRAFETIQRMLRAISEEAYLAHKKKSISQADLAEIMKEFTLIQNSLEKAEKIEIPSLSTKIKGDMKKYSPKYFLSHIVKSFKPSLTLSPIVKQPPVECSSTNQETPAAAVLPPPVKQNLISPTLTVQEAFTELKTCSFAEAKEILSRVPFAPYKRNNQAVFIALIPQNFDIDPNSGWASLTKQEAIQWMELLNGISKKIENHYDETQKISIDDYEILLRISTLVYFLDHHFFTGSQNTSSLFSIKNEIEEFYKYSFDINWIPSLFAKKYHEQYHRVGLRTDPLNGKFLKEYRTFFKAFSKKNGTPSSTNTGNFFEMQKKIIEKIHGSLYQPATFFLSDRIKAWARPLQSAFLLAAYRNMEIRIGNAPTSAGTGLVDQVFDARQITEKEKQRYEDQLSYQYGMRTQEAVIDDPEQVAAFLENDLEEITTELMKWRGKSQQSLKKGLSQDFTKEDIKALLLLLRDQDPQTEIVAFLERYPSLLGHPEARNFVDLLFFHPCLIETLEKREVFRNSLPLFFTTQIRKFEAKANENSKYASQLVVFLAFSSKLREIYTAHNYSTDDFIDANPMINQWIERTKETETLHSLLPELLSLNISSLLNKEDLSREEVAQLITNYNTSILLPTDPLTLDPIIQERIKGRYASFMAQLSKNPGPIEGYTAILEAICRAKKIVLSNPHWQGTFPIFNNGQYTLNLQEGTIHEISTKRSLVKMPETILLNPFFQSSFDDVNFNQAEIFQENQEGVKIYRFTDSRGQACHIEEEKNVYRFYKLLPNISQKPLQLVPASTFLNTDKKINYLFAHDFLVDPQNPLLGYSVSKKGELLFKIQFKEQSTDFKDEKRIILESITDCQDHTGPWEATNAADYTHPLLDRLECFENRSEILIWSQKGKIEKIELPRYGLSFDVQGNDLFCKNSQHKGYRIDLEASPIDKKGIDFSLLLVHPDKEMPKKLLVPKASLVQEKAIKIKKELTWLAELIKGFFKFLSFIYRPLGLRISQSIKVFSKNLLAPTELPFIKQQIVSTAFSLDYAVVHLRPYTEEFIFNPSNKISDGLEIANHAIRSRRGGTALEAIDSLQLTKKDLDKKNVSTLIRFIREKVDKSGSEAAIKLKFICSIKKLMKQATHLKKIVKELDHLSSQWMTTYINETHLIPAHLRLSKIEFLKLAQTIKKTDPESYKKTLASHFQKEKTFSPFVEYQKHEGAASEGVPFEKPNYEWNELYRDSHPLAQSLYSEAREIARKNLKNRARIYSFEGFNWTSHACTQCENFFLPLYQIFMEKPTSHPEFQKMAWAMEVMAISRQYPLNRGELVYDMLRVLLAAKKNGVDLSSFPLSPAVEKKDNYSFEEERTIEKFIQQVFIQYKKLKITQPSQNRNISSPPLFVEENLVDSLEEQLTQAKEEGVSKRLSLTALEQLIHPSETLSQEQLTYSFSFGVKNSELLFKTTDLKTYFTEKQVVIPNFTLPPIPENTSSSEKVGLEELTHHLETYKKNKTEQKEWSLDRSPVKIKNLKELLTSKIATLTKEKVTAQQKIKNLIYSSKDPVEQAAIIGNIKKMASPSELMLALLRKDFERLKKEGNVPADIDITQLKQALIAYYDSEIKLNAAQIGLERLTHLVTGEVDEATWKVESMVIYQLLTGSHHYSVEENPELLLFELFSFITFRHLNQNTHQLQVLLDILQKPSGITQAVTGAGKTKVLSILRCLMKANGKNLISQKVLPGLYNQTLKIMQELLGDTFKVAIYPLRFDLKMRLTETKNYTQEGEIVSKQTSIFKGMYHKLLETIHNKGCVVTDYKSFPLLEQKFIKLNRQLLAMRTEGVVQDPLLIEHWQYLRKILILLENKEDSMMDEFDEPNRPIQRIQTQMDKAKTPASFLFEDSLALFDLLEQEEGLMLRDNMQGEVSEAMRLTAIQKVAEKIAERFVKEPVTKQDVMSYFQGRGEGILEKIGTWTPREKDSLVFCKDQINTYLPLTLSYSRKSRYTRSSDGKRILPCSNGRKHDAKFGSIQEEINCFIADYLQGGVMEAELQEWITDLIKDFDNEVRGTEERFRTIFPTKSLEKIEEYSLKALLAEVNGNREPIKFFLRRRLQALTMSGEVVSMDPQNIVSMSRTVSGLSATLGGIDSLHKQFTIDRETAGQIQAEMIYRMAGRLVSNEAIVYDPQHPLELLDETQKKSPISAVIDGAGAFNNVNPDKLSETFLKSNPQLKKVGIHDDEGHIKYTGEIEAPLALRGHIFTEPNTRGVDVTLPAQAKAVITVNAKGNIEDFNQQEGRMRRGGQKILLARSKFTPELDTVSKIVQIKTMYGSRKEAENLCRSKKQELQNILRKHARKAILRDENLDRTLDQFEKLKGIFIVVPAPNYEEPGSYFDRHKKIREKNQKPTEVLSTERERLKKTCHDLGLDQAVAELDAVTYSPELIKKMPEAVFSPHESEETETEVELETEQEQEIELETEFELEQEQEKEIGLSKDLPYYLPRTENHVTHSLKNTIHPAYDKEIAFTESFLPLTRKDPLYRRKAFDDKMYSVGTVAVVIEFERNLGLRGKATLQQVIIGDLLDDTTLHPNKTTGHQQGFYYDIRTGQVNGVIKKGPGLGLDSPIQLTDIETIVNSEEFQSKIAQIKFFNGQINNYTDLEMEALKKWLLANNKITMRQHFEKEIIQNRPEISNRYPHSQLWDLFNS